MANHLETGKHGEEIAAAHLLRLGFQILETNWRHRRLEVDIIAKEGETLVFVEVKTRSYDYFGRPEEFVTPGKERRLAEAAAAFMEKSGHDWAMRFDVVSVLMKNATDYTVEHIRDAFFPGIV